MSPFKASKFNQILLHSLVSETDKNVPLIVFHFHMKWSKRNTLTFFFSKEEIARFYIWNFESGRKVHFLQLPWDNQTFRSLKLCLHKCCPSDKLSRTIWIMLLLQISFYNPGDKSFETDNGKHPTFPKIIHYSKSIHYSKIVHYSRQNYESFPKMSFLLKLSDWIKSYGHSFK